MNITKYVKIFREISALRISQVAAFGASFFVNVLTSIISNFLWPIVAVVLYAQTSGFPGWSIGEFILLQGTILLSFGIAGSSIFSIVWDIGWQIDEGLFDMTLLKPMGVIPGIIATSFNPWFIADIASGAVLVVTGIISSGAVISLLNILSYTILIASSMLVWFFFASLILSLNFKYLEAWGIFELFWTVKRLGEYPIDIYGGFLKFLLTFVIPFGLAGFYPAQILLGRITDWTQILILIVSSFVFGIVGYLILNRSIKNYSSAGG
ncbi:MAG: ABC-2 family transporter protein [Candidatus Nanoarchaeia archaeon]|nr:ABC-2 family transporter protein [Candidatus Nanoarchaeia archaeon]